MKQLRKRFLAVIVCFAMIVSVLSHGGAVYAAEGDGAEYQIYPIPHEMTYQEGNYDILSDVNVVYESGIDDVTKDRMEAILETKDTTVTISNAVQNGKTNILVGIYGSNGYVDTYVENNYSIESDVFNEYSGHYVISNEGEIIVLGLDTDAAFYGITSLKHIFNQMEGMNIRNFTIKDFADTSIRGFIEGYYGIPWSNEDRMSLMKFGGDFKMTSYVFAPKDDPYHTSKWRDLYPQDEIDAIAEMVELGNSVKCRFVWTAHPFMGGFNSSDVNGEIDALLDKFEQLYSVGVRQFGVLGDDVGSLNKNIVVQVMNAVSDWANDKGDVYDSVFCPAGYNHQMQDSSYYELNTYDANFPDDINIFWTGEAVCKPITQATLEHFRRYNATGGERRAPLFWLNWPVNDINGERLMMGKGSLLENTITVDDLAGVVTNPMQEAEASKVAIFAVADYSWNVKAFDDDQSWEDSFAYIDADASEELHTLAKHMSNPQPNGHGLVLAESEELQPLIDEFKVKLAAGQSILETGAQLAAEMDVIIDACDGFHEKSKNEDLKDELLPFTGSLKDLAAAIKNYTLAAMELEEGDKTAAFEYFVPGSEAMINSENHIRYSINSSDMVSPGSTHLIPLAETLEEAIADEILSYVFGETEGGVKLKASSNMEAFYDGSVDDIIDGDTSTHAWYGNASQVGLYYQVSLSEPSTVYGINILNGSAATGKGEDTFQSAKLQYTTDGTTWIDVPNGATTSSYQESLTVSDLELENVVAVRYICTTAGNKWPSMREFTVQLTRETVENVPEFTCEVIRTTDGWSIYEGTDSNAIDGSDSSYVWYNVRMGQDQGNTMIVGDYFGVKLSQPIKLGKIHIAQGTDGDSDDYMKKAKLQYSMDGEEWIDIQNVTTSTIDVDLTYQNITAQYVRLVKTEENQNNWYAIREFKVSARGDYNGICYTNTEEYKGVKANLGLERHELQQVNDVTLKAGEYIGLKLDRIHELENIALDVNASNLTLQVSANSVEWTNVTAGAVNADARYIRLLNETDADVTFNINELVVSTVEVEGKSVEDTNYTSIGGDITQLFDNDWTTSVQFANSQNAGKYVVIDLGSEITLNTFKAVCTDTELDFVRHGKFSVSANGQDWTEIMTIGSQNSANPGETDNTDNINEVLPDHEISYNTKSVSDLEVPTRYLKFEVTRTKEGTDRWVRFQEFEINGGAFIPTINDPTVEAGEQKADNQYGYMMDKNLFSAYTWTGDMIYHESEEEAFNTVKIVQSGISNAAVSVRLAGTNEYVNVGKLSETIKEFTVDGEILDVKISANGDTPCSVTEILFAAKSVEDIVPEETDKSVLEETIAAAETLKEEDYTAESWAALETALAEAVEAAEDENATNAEITAATNKLLAAIKDLEESAAPEVSTDPTDGSKDVPADQYTATAGSTQTGNSPDRAIDGDTNSFWEVVWDIGGTNPEKLWYQIELDEVTEVDAVRYYPRWGNNEGDQNGFIEAYRIEVSLDGESYETAAEGTWERTAGWKLALFDEPVHAKYVRLVATSTYSDVDDVKGENSNLSIAEIRVREASAASVVKKAALKVAIALAETKVEADYTAESWAAADLENEIAAAQAVVDNAAATQEEVNAATAALEAAMDLLEEKGEEPPVEEEGEVVRISGKDRYATGYAAAEALKEALGVDKFDAVVVATGKNFADALSGSYLAIVKEAPILLTNGKDDNVAELHAYIKENVNANGTVYILGGSAAVPETVEAIEGYTVKRLAGASRYDTNLEILAEAGITGTELIVATGKEFADSLSASATGRPILLVKPGAALSAEQKAIVETVKDGNIYVVGGTGAVAETTAAELESYATVERIAGAGRQETSKKIAEKFFADAKAVAVANAKNFPDGLCGGPLAAAMNAPLLLTATGNTAIAEGYVQGNDLTSGVVLGGTGALSDEAVVDVFGLESAEDIILK